MTTALALFALLTLLALVGVVAHLVHEVRRDGYGTRPAPSSHHAWDDGLRPRLP
ncbi:hypothetical protein [Serinibacter arcticus]|uniref:hypothetical protein n=1 Tax=Serinibacter arcticus TaxID=1655435 RepID=UPI0018EEBF5A|nr:hypothetical protein [Serinibacter arcticus]